MVKGAPFLNSLMCVRIVLITVRKSRLNGLEKDRWISRCEKRTGKERKGEGGKNDRKIHQIGRE